MKKLSKEKKLHLLLVALVTAGVIVGLWVGLISAQKQKIQDIARKSQNVLAEIEKVQKVVAEAPEVEQALQTATNRLSTIEAGIPSTSGDLFSWIITTLKQFNVPSYKVDMPQISAPALGDVRLYPKFPYSQAVVTVSGTAYYYDFGKFVADLENHFPYMRVENLSLEAGFGANADEREKLNFRMEIATLTKPVAK